MNSSTDTPDLLSGRAIFRIGLGLLLLAAVFFLRYSIDQGWIGPEARVGLAGGTGILMIVAGLQIAGRRPAYGTLLQGGGAAVCYLTAFAAHRHYGLVGTTETFLALVVVSTAVVGLALNQRAETLGTVGILGAFAAPLLIHGRIAGFPGDAGYLAIIAGAAVAMFAARRWLRVYAAGLLGSAASLFVELIRFEFGRMGEPATAAELTLQATVVYLAFWAVPLVMTRRRAIPDGPAMAGTFVAPLLAGVTVLTAWSLSDSQQMAVALGLAAVHVLAAWWLWTTQRLTAAVQLLPASILAAAGWALGLDGAALALMLTVQAAAMVWLGFRSGFDNLVVGGHLLFVTAATVWGYTVVLGADAVFDGFDLAALGTLAATATLGVLLRESDDEVERLVGGVYLTLAGLTLAGWSMFSLRPLPNGQAFLTAAWAAQAAGMIVIGRRSRLVRNSGMGLLLVAVGKLLLIDTATVAPLGRMALFAGVGVGLLALGYWLGDGPTSAEPVEEPPVTTQT